jgi:hypothetical protein
MMDPVSLFGIALGATVAGVSILALLYGLVKLYKAMRSPPLPPLQTPPTLNLATVTIQS